MQRLGGSAGVITVELFHVDNFDPFGSGLFGNDLGPAFPEGSFTAIMARVLTPLLAISSTSAVQKILSLGGILNTHFFCGSMGRTRRLVDPER